MKNKRGYCGPLRAKQTKTLSGLFRGMSVHAALPIVPDPICGSFSVDRPNNEAQHVLATKQFSSSTLTALAAQSFFLNQLHFVPCASTSK